MTIRELLKSQMKDEGMFTVSYRSSEFTVEILCFNETIVIFHTNDLDSDQIREVTVVDDEEDPINVSITDMKGYLNIWRKQKVLMPTSI